MNIKAAIFGVCTATVWLAATGPTAATPPPPDPRAVKYNESMQTLDPFLGDWRGTFDGMRVRVRREVVLGPHGEFYLALCDGCRQPNGYNELDVLQFDVEADSYELFRPGFDYERKTRLKIQSPRAATIQWDENVGDGTVINRTTISVQDGIWHEVCERVHEDGRTTPLSSITLKRVGEAPILIAPPAG